MNIFVTLVVDLINVRPSVLDLLVLQLTLCQRISLNFPNVKVFHSSYNTHCMIPSFCPIETLGDEKLSLFGKLLTLPQVT